jgi:hypothetical protein
MDASAQVARQALGVGGVVAGRAQFRRTAMVPGTGAFAAVVLRGISEASRAVCSIPTGPTSLTGGCLP